MLHTTASFVLLRHSSHHTQCSAWNFQRPLFTKSCLHALNVSPQNLYVDIVTSRDADIRRWGLWRCLGDKDGALMNGISVLIKEMPQSSLTPSAMWGHSMQLLEPSEPGRGPSPECDYVGTLILDFPVSKTSRNKFLLFLSYPVCGVLLKQPKGTKILSLSFKAFCDLPKLNTCSLYLHSARQSFNRYSLSSYCILTLCQVTPKGIGYNLVLLIRELIV